MGIGSRVCNGRASARGTSSEGPMLLFFRLFRCGSAPGSRGQRRRSAQNHGLLHNQNSSECIIARLSKIYEHYQYHWSNNFVYTLRPLPPVVLDAERPPDGGNPGSPCPFKALSARQPASVAPSLGRPGTGDRVRHFCRQASTRFAPRFHRVAPARKARPGSRRHRAPLAR